MEVVWWILGALLVLASALLAIVHASVMRRFDSLEERVGRVENLLLTKQHHQ